MIAKDTRSSGTGGARASVGRQRDPSLEPVALDHRACWTPCCRRPRARRSARTAACELAFTEPEDRTDHRQPRLGGQVGGRGVGQGLQSRRDLGRRLAEAGTDELLGSPACRELDGDRGQVAPGEALVAAQSRNDAGGQTAEVSSRRVRLERESERERAVGVVGRDHGPHLCAHAAGQTAASAERLDQGLGSLLGRLLATQPSWRLRPMGPPGACAVAPRSRPARASPAARTRWGR